MVCVYDERPEPRGSPRIAVTARQVALVVRVVVFRRADESSNRNRADPERLESSVLLTVSTATTSTAHIDRRSSTGAAAASQ